MELFAACDAALRATAVDRKLAIVADLARALDDATLVIDRTAATTPIDAPGRPAEPRLVPPAELATRGVGAPLGRAAMLHAIAHIEFNAIHLALDACHRFPAMPDAYHRDWARVAVEEAKHFALLAATLEQRGWRYGSFPAHDGLWDMARRTAGDVLVRMALVPRVLEARGLDVTPGIRARFAKAGDDAAVAILDVILADEIGHVAIGNHWFRSLCSERGWEPGATFAALAREYRVPRPQGPLNRAARLAGGFTEAELDGLV